MYKNIILAIGITILFLGMSITPSVAIDTIQQSSMSISDKTVITVDNEGDGDYTTIKEAVLNANSGDTIEVYSGKYPEGDILINKEEIVLKGISYELGSGNDTGKPFLFNESNYIIKIIANDVILTWFKIENFGGYGDDGIHCFANGSSITNNVITDGYRGIYAYGNQNVIERNIISTRFGINVYGKNCVISNNNIDTTGDGIKVSSGSRKVTISNNIINSGQDGIELVEGTNNCVITRNRITSRGKSGIDFEYCYFNTVFLNEIINSYYGIAFECCYFNTVFLNEIKNSHCGIALVHSTLNLIKQNNFINNSNHSAFYGRILFNRNRWINNYWDDWNGSGPYKVKGRLLLFHIPWVILSGFLVPILIPIAIPWINIDWFPARKPYNIGTAQGCDIV